MRPDDRHLDDGVGDHRSFYVCLSTSRGSQVLQPRHSKTLRRPRIRRRFPVQPSQVLHLLVLR